MSLRKKLNIACMVISLLLVVNIFLPAQKIGDISISYWGNGDHTSAIFYLIEFLGACTMYALYQFNIMKDNKFSLIFLGDFMVNSIFILIKSEDLGSYTFGYWFGFILIVALIALTFVSNYVSDKVKPKMPYNRYNGNGYNGGGQIPPYNMYNQPQQPYNQGPMGYNNYR